MDEPVAITRLLDDIRLGRPGAESELFALVYSSLRRLASSKLGDHAAGHTLQPTALVNEATYRLLRRSRPLELGQNRTQFFALAASAMRSVLVDYARRRRAMKRSLGENRQQQPLDYVVVQLESRQQVDVLVLDESLQLLKQHSQRQHDIVVLHFFGGLTHGEIANYLSVSVSTVEKDWYFARTWLRRQLSRTR